MKDNKLHYMKLCSEICQNNIKLKNLAYVFFGFQNCRMTFGVEDASLATLEALAVDVFYICKMTQVNISIHQRNLQLLVTEIHRIKMNINPSFMKEIFVEREIHHNTYE